MRHRKVPCTAEPEWAFADSVGLLSQDYHVIQIVYDGHGETGEDFISVETTVDEVTDWLQQHGITNLEAAYGCSLGGACLTHFLALGKIPVKCAVIDAGITPYQMPLILRPAFRTGKSGCPLSAPKHAYGRPGGAGA